MNLYFDTEFTGLVPGTTLISLGIVSETGDKFYAEFTDYDRSKITPWIEEHVISNLAAKKEVKPIEHRQRRLWMSIPPMYEESWTYTDLHEELMNDSSVEYYCGSTNYIREKLLEWIKWHAHELKGKKPQRVQFVSDVCHYDFYLLQNQVFGGAFEMPEYINPVCYDICQDINELSCMGVGNNFNMTNNMHNAFDISREELVKDALLELPKGTKHNALYDAEVIKILYEYYYSKKLMRRKMETIKNFRTHTGWCRDSFDSWFEDSEYVATVDSNPKELYEKALKAIKEYSKNRKSNYDIDYSALNEKE